MSFAVQIKVALRSLCSILSKKLAAPSRSEYVYCARSRGAWAVSGTLNNGCSGYANATNSRHAQDRFTSLDSSTSRRNVSCVTAVGWQLEGWTEVWNRWLRSRINGPPDARRLIRTHATDSSGYQGKGAVDSIARERFYEVDFDPNRQKMPTDGDSVFMCSGSD